MGWNPYVSIGGAGDGSAIDWPNPIAINTATTLTIEKHHVISDLGSPADYTVTLPAVSGNAGKLISFEMAEDLTKLVTVDGNASEEIDGETSRAMWAMETAILSCDGSKWTKVGGKSIPMISSMDSTVNTLVPISTFTTIEYDAVISDPAGLVDLANERFVIKRAGLYQLESIAAFSDYTNPSDKLIGDTLGFVQTSMHVGTWPDEIISSLYAEHQVDATHWMIHIASYNLTVGESVSIQAFSKIRAARIHTDTKPSFKIMEVLVW